MPYGMLCALSIFQCFINDVLWHMLGRFVIAYIDDIRTYSPSPPEHISHNMPVLEWLRGTQLYLKAEKCKFIASKILFLTFAIRDEGVAMDKEKDMAITTWSRPTTIKELQRIWILSYRGFGSRKLACNFVVEKAFIQLKQAFTTTPALSTWIPENLLLLKSPLTSWLVGDHPVLGLWRKPQAPIPKRCFFYLKNILVEKKW